MQGSLRLPLDFLLNQLHHTLSLYYWALVCNHAAVNAAELHLFDMT